MALSSVLVVWNKWNIRGFVILSLLFQIFLVLFAPLRKKTSNNHILSLLWLAYVMADWVAAFTIGLISQNQGESCAHAAEIDKALQAFWASFLLLHLGGPDTITAFSLEDSSLWQRHLSSLIFQGGATIYVFVKIFLSNKSLVIPTMLVFLAGAIKNVERTRALYLSSLPRLREWVLSLHQSTIAAGEEVQKELGVQVKGVSNEEEAKLAESIVVKHAYHFFHIFKVFLGDLMFIREERQMSREYFREVSAVDALRVISVELQFIYEVLHTKVLAIHSIWSYISRFVAFASVLIALVLFNCLKKHRLSEVDVRISYTLLFGGIALEVIALFMLIFSDWTVAQIKWYKFRPSRHSQENKTTGPSIIDKFMDDLRKPRFAKCKAERDAEVTYTILDTRSVFKRWSESISACNLLSEAREVSPRKMHKIHQCCDVTLIFSICGCPFRMAGKIISCFQQAGGCGPGFRYYGSAAAIAKTKYSTSNPFIKELWIFIFTEVKRISEKANDEAQVKEIFEARGDLFLKSILPESDVEAMGEEDPGTPSGSGTEGGGEKQDRLRIRVDSVTHSTLSDSVTKETYDDSVIMWHIATEMWYNKEKPTAKDNEREFSKILSDYMFYLLVNQPEVMSAVAGTAQLTSGKVYTELRGFGRGADEQCTALFGPDGDNSKLTKARKLAKQMEMLGERKWEVMSGVWVEMLCYAATHAKGESHAKVLSQGGELVAFVWLLMAHFGCFYKPAWGMSYDYWD